MDWPRYGRKVIQAFLLVLCAAALLAGSCAPLREIVNWDGGPSSTDQSEGPRKRVPLPPTVHDFEESATPPGPDDW